MAEASTAVASRDVDGQIGRLREDLKHIGPLEGGGLWADVAERFRALRTLYAESPNALRGRVPELTDLRRQYDARLDANVADAVDRYHRLGAEIRRAEAEREFLRQFFVRKAGARPMEIPGKTAQVTIQARSSLSMPKAGSAERDRLDQTVRASGKWEEVSQLATAKLLRAMEQKHFTPAEADAIEKLCPRTLSHVVRTSERIAQ